MDIGIVSSILNPKSGARAPIELAKALAKRNKVTFYALKRAKDAKTEEALKQNGIKVTFFETQFELFPLLKKAGHEVLSTHTTLSLLFVARLSGIPIVNAYYGTQFNVLDERFLKQNFVTKFLNKLLNIVIFLKGLLLVWLPNKVVAISKYCQAEVKRLYKRSCDYIYLGNAPRHFIKSKFKSKSKKINLLSVSRITPYKQFEKIIEAVNKLDPDVALTIIGSSPQPKYLKLLMELGGPNVKIAVNASDRKLIELYRSCDIYATADKYLFFGMPILEAASFGKPAIALNYAAAPELIVHRKTGFIAKNEKEFLYYIKRLIKNQDLRERLGRNAFRQSKRFSWEKCAREWEKVLKKAVSHQNGEILQ